ARDRTSQSSQCRDYSQRDESQLDSVLRDRRQTGGIDHVRDVAVSVEILVQAEWFVYFSGIRIHRHEATAIGIVVTRSQVIDAEISIDSLTSVEVRIRRRTGLRDHLAKRIERVGVSHYTRFVGELPHTAVTIKRIEAGGPGVRCNLPSLADDRVAVRVLRLNLAVDELFDDLRVVGRVQVVDEIARRYTTDGFSCEVTVAVINHVDWSTGALQTVFEVVGVTSAVEVSSVAVRVIQTRRQSIVVVVSRRLRQDRRDI